MIVALAAATAAAAGTAVVAAAATDAWEFARDGVVGFFRRDGDRAAEKAAARLDQDAAAIAAAAPEDREQIRTALVPSWQTRLRDLLEDYPEAVEELKAWADRVREQLPAVQQQWVQHNTASGQGATVYGVQGGDQTIHHHGTGGPPPGRPTRSDPVGGAATDGAAR